MGKSRLLVVSAIAAFALALSANASAATVTIGSSLSSLPLTNQCSVVPCDLIQTTLPQPGTHVVSPVTGAVVSWRIVGGAAGKKYRLRVFTPNGALSYTSTGASAVSSPGSAALQTFPTAIPIKVGQAVGIELEPGAPLAYASVPGAQYNLFSPALGEGATGTATPGVTYELGYNAQVLPAPGLVAVLPTSGSVKGGTSVAIAGTDFAQVQGVSFGAIPASSFTVNSEGLITAVAPPSATLGSVGVTVTTVAGTTASTQTFTYAGCKVPKLADGKLKASKKRIRKAGCRVGKVRREDGVTAKTGVVVKQNPKPGKVRAPGTKVNVKLGE